VLDAHSTLKSLRHDDYNCALCAAGYEASVDEQVEVAFTVSPRVRRIAADGACEEVPFGDPLTALQEEYPSLADGWIAGHCDIAPGRKTDPGPAFDWARLEHELRMRGAAFRREVLA